MGCFFLGCKDVLIYKINQCNTHDITRIKEKQKTKKKTHHIISIHAEKGPGKTQQPKMIKMNKLRTKENCFKLTKATYEKPVSNSMMKYWNLSKIRNKVPLFSLTKPKQLKLLKVPKASHGTLAWQEMRGIQIGNKIVKLSMYVHISHNFTGILCCYFFGFYLCMCTLTHTKAMFCFLLLLLVTFSMCSKMNQNEYNHSSRH